MADEADIANDRQEIELQRSLAAIRTQAVKEEPKVRHCLNCAAKTIDGAKFCNSDCSTDYEKRRRNALR